MPINKFGCNISSLNNLDVFSEVRKLKKPYHHIEK